MSDQLEASRAQKSSALQRQSTKYGSLDLPKDELVEYQREKFCATMFEWGRPEVLFITSWFDVLPWVLIPLWWITYSNMTDHKFFLPCGTALPDPSFTRALCDVSYVCLASFADVCRSAAVLLITWRLIRQRLFYVFLQRKILINFSALGFTKGILILEVLLFVGSLCHFALFCMYGKARDVTDFRSTNPMGSTGDWTPTQNWTPANMTDPPLVNVELTDLATHPYVLLEPENATLVKWLVDYVGDFIIPAIVAVMFSRQLDDVEFTLIPLSKYFEHGTNYADLHLSESVFLHDDVAREVLNTNAECSSELDDSLDEACNMFLEKARQYRGTRDVSGFRDIRKSGSRDDIEQAPSSTSANGKETTLSPLGLMDLVFTTWWPLEIICKNDTSLKGVSWAFQFRQVWSMHCILCFLVVTGDFCRLSYGLSNVYVRWGDPYRRLSGAVVYLVCMVPFALVLLFTLGALARHIYKNANKR